MTRLQQTPAARAPLTIGSPARAFRTQSTPRRSAPSPLAAVSKRAALLGLLGGALLGQRGTATAAAAMTAEQVDVAFSYVDAFLKLGLLGAVWLASRGQLTAEAAMAEQVLRDVKWPEQWPFRPDQFERYDESSDVIFYDSPRFVTHIDDGAINALTKFYGENFPPAGQKDVALLDLCSSWISHYPKDYSASRIAGLGMNVEELARNKVLTEYAVKDLNTDPSLPYEDESFDVITNAVSVDYLVKPLEIFREMHRVLKPGGLAIMSFSNRCFPTKAISIWTSTGDLDHILIVGSYFHYSVPGGYTPPEAKDISPAPGLFGAKGDPMYVVYARKQQA